MIEHILPDRVVAVDTRKDLLDITLFPREERALGNAVEKRQREFTTARACARAALEELGLPPAPIVSGSRGEPLGPDGMVGSITHCDEYRGCAIARTGDFVTIGIDAERHEPLPPRVLAAVARLEELRR
jgi:4'-phosphopantetheinyl transferase EntD